MKLHFIIINLSVLFCSPSTTNKQINPFEYDNLVLNGIFKKIICNYYSELEQKNNANDFLDRKFDKLDENINEFFLEYYGNLESRISNNIEFINPIEKECIKKILSKIFELFFDNWMLIKIEKEENILFWYEQFIIEKNNIKQEVFKNVISSDKSEKNHYFFIETDFKNPNETNYLNEEDINKYLVSTGQNNFYKNTTSINEQYATCNLSPLTCYKLFKTLTDTKFCFTYIIQNYKYELFDCLYNYYRIILTHLDSEIFKNSKTGLKNIKLILLDTTIKLKFGLEIIFNKLETAILQHLLE